MEVTNVWQPWKLNLTTYSCPGSSKSYKSTFWFSGFPKFAYQGAHISLGRNCLNSIPPQDIRQIASLQPHTAGIHGKFCHTFFLISSWTVSERASGGGRDWVREASGHRIEVGAPIFFFSAAPSPPPSSNSETFRSNGAQISRMGADKARCLRSLRSKVGRVAPRAATTSKRYKLFFYANRLFAIEFFCQFLRASMYALERRKN